MKHYDISSHLNLISWFGRENIWKKRKWGFVAKWWLKWSLKKISFPLYIQPGSFDQNLWTMGLPSDVSWTVRKIFWLRDVCQPLIRYKVGNGASISIWLDNWHPLGPLHKKYGEQVCAHVGRSLHARVSSQS